MFDIFQDGIQGHKEAFTYHLFHCAAEKPDGNQRPYWNSSRALDSLTFEALPAELEKVHAVSWPLKTARTYISLKAPPQLFGVSCPTFSHIRAIF
jgi:hypothetical protein